MTVTRFRASGTRRLKMQVSRRPLAPVSDRDSPRFTRAIGYTTSILLEHPLRIAGVAPIGGGDVVVAVQE
jgi:hypothetical protein